MKDKTPNLPSEKRHMKTKLYLDVDGVVLRRTGRSTARGMTEFEVANNAAKFLRWCADNFDCFWLTARSREGDVAEVERAFRFALRNQNSSEQERTDLKALVSAVPVAKWGATKADSFCADEDFFWIDDDPTAASLIWLEQHGLSSRLVVASTDQHPDDLARVQGVLDKLTTDMSRDDKKLDLVAAPREEWPRSPSWLATRSRIDTRTHQPRDRTIDLGWLDVTLKRPARGRRIKDKIGSVTSQLKRDRAFAQFMAGSHAHHHGKPPPDPAILGPAAFTRITPTMSREQIRENLITALESMGQTVK